MKYPLLFGFLIIIFISSCEVSHYMPPAVSAPFFKEAGEGIIQAFGGANHLEFQGAYAFTKNFAAMTDIWVGFDGRYSFELAPGLFRMNKNNLCFEGFAGFGFASASAVNEVSRKDLFLSGITYTTKYVVTAPYQFLFFQPAFGYRHRLWEIGVAPRISYIRYSEFRYDLYEKDNNYQRKYVLTDQVKRENLDFWAFQPTLIVRAGLSKVKVFVSTSVNIINVSHKWEIASMDIIPAYQPTLLAIGLHLRLGQKAEDKKQDKEVQ